MPPVQYAYKISGRIQKTAGWRRTFCLGSGIITIVRSASIEERRGTTYRLNYQFKRGQVVSSFIDGLIILYTRTVTRNICSKDL